MGPNANLTDADLAGQYLASSNLDRANLTDADLSQRRRNLSNGYVTFASSASTNLADATLAGITSHDVEGTPAAALPSGWEIMDGVLKPIPAPSGEGSRATISSAAAAPEPAASKAAAPKATADAKVTAAPQRPITPRRRRRRPHPSSESTSMPRTSCKPAAVWQAEHDEQDEGHQVAGGEQRRNRVCFVLVAGSAENTVFAADLCGETKALPLPSSRPNPARLAVLMHAAPIGGLFF